MTACAFCTHPAHEHEAVGSSPDSGRCFATGRAGKARACACDACADAQRLYGHEPRCGCPAFVAAPARRESA